jgi:hypothetical protein
VEERDENKAVPNRQKKKRSTDAEREPRPWRAGFLDADAEERR